MSPSRCGVQLIGTIVEMGEVRINDRGDETLDGFGEFPLLGGSVPGSAKCCFVLPSFS